MGKKGTKKPKQQGKDSLLTKEPLLPYVELDDVVAKEK